MSIIDTYRLPIPTGVGTQQRLNFANLKVGELYYLMTPQSSRDGFCTEIKIVSSRIWCGEFELEYHSARCYCVGGRMVPESNWITEAALEHPKSLNKIYDKPTRRAVVKYGVYGDNNPRRVSLLVGEYEREADPFMCAEGVLPKNLPYPAKR